MAFLNSSIINIFFMASTFILSILCIMVSFTAWPFFRGATNCNVRNPSNDCKDMKKINYGKYIPMVLLAVAVYFTYVRITSGFF